MGKMKEKTFNLLICFLTGLLVGILIGTVILTILVGYRIDEQYKKIATLENSIEEKDIKLQKLETSITAQTMVLQDIDIRLILEEEIEEMDKIVIEKSIKEKYISLFGKEIKTIDSEVLVEVIDKRILKIEKKEYQLYVEKLILTETLRIFVKIQVKKP